MAVSVSFDEALARGRLAILALLEAEGGVLTGEEVVLQGIFLGEKVTRRGGSVVDVGVLVLPGPIPLYPAFQFKDGAVLPGVMEVLADLGDTPPLMAAQFFLTSQVGDLRPTDALRMGRIEEAREAARAFVAER